MSNTSFHFKHMFLLSAFSFQSHATSCSSIMSHYRFNNKRNRVKGQCWRWLIYTLHSFLLHNMLCSFRSNQHCSWKFHKFHRKTPVLESLFERIVGYCFFFKMMKLSRLFCMNKLYFCRNYFVTDRCHKGHKNIIDLMLFYGEHWIFGKWFMKMSKKRTFISQQTYVTLIHQGHRHFEVLWSFILYIL